LQIHEVFEFQENPRGVPLEMPASLSEMKKRILGEITKRVLANSRSF
jgi:hypothetical protein